MNTNSIQIDSPKVSAKPSVGNSKRLTLLSTYFENIGDDLIRFGILHLLQKSGFNRQCVDFIAKANPLSLYFPTSPIFHGPFYRMPERQQYYLARLNNFLSRNPLARRWNKVLNSSGVIVAGTPLFHLDDKVSFLKNDRWIPEVFEKCLAPNPSIGLCSLGLGSVIDFDPKDLWELYPREAEFIQRYVERSSFIATRDEVTYELLLAAAPAADSNKIVRSICPSVFGYRQLGINREPSSVKGRKVCLSFSLESSHWHANPEEVRRSRLETVESIVETLKKQDCTIQLISHNKLDFPLQEDLASKFRLPRPLKATTKTMLKEFAKARLVVTWRVHGALGALSLGVPAILFRTDNRAAMAEELGGTVIDEPLPSKDVVLEQITSAFNEAPERSENLINHLEPIRNKEETRLLELIEQELAGIQANPIQ